MSITNPEYYTNTSIEPIEVIEEWGLSFHRHYKENKNILTLMKEVEKYDIAREHI